MISDRLERSSNDAESTCSSITALCRDLAQVLHSQQLNAIDAPSNDRVYTSGLWREISNADLLHCIKTTRLALKAFILLAIDLTFKRDRTTRAAIQAKDKPDFQHDIGPYNRKLSTYYTRNRNRNSQVCANLQRSMCFSSGSDSFTFSVLDA